MVPGLAYFSGAACCSESACAISAATCAKCHAYLPAWLQKLVSCTKRTYITMEGSHLHCTAARVWYHQPHSLCTSCPAAACTACLTGTQCTLSPHKV